MPAPKLARDEKRHGDVDDFGALEHLPRARVAPRPEGSRCTAAEGWGGDRYVALHASAAPTVRSACASRSRGDTAADTREIADAFDAVDRRAPDGAASLQRVGDRVTLTACDVGGVTAPTEATLDAAVDLLVTATTSRSSSSHAARAGEARTLRGRPPRR